MKTILFKAKEKDTNKWVFGNYLKQTNGSFSRHYIVQSILVENNKLEFVEIIPETLCQYILINDVNDNKIFTGDILSYKTRCFGRFNGEQNYEEAEFVVEYDNKTAYLDFPSKYASEIKVIGNIYDNNFE